jgi:hypothetical protein
MFHTRTLDIFAQIVEKEVSKRVRHLNQEIDNLKTELAFYCSEKKAKQDIEMAENAKAEWTEVSAEDNHPHKESTETAFDATEEKIQMSKFRPNTWLGDTGASVHYVNNDTGMYDVR